MGRRRAHMFGKKKTRTRARRIVGALRLPGVRTQRRHTNVVVIVVVGPAVSVFHIL